MSLVLNSLDDMIGILSGRLEKVEATAKKAEATTKTDFSSLLSLYFGYPADVSTTQVAALEGAINLTQCVREVVETLPEEKRADYIAVMGFLVAIRTAENTAPSLLGAMATLMRQEIEGHKQ